MEPTGKGSTHKHPCAVGNTELSVNLYTKEVTGMHIHLDNEKVLCGRGYLIPNHDRALWEYIILPEQKVNLEDLAGVSNRTADWAV